LNGRPALCGTQAAQCHLLHPARKVHHGRQHQEHLTTQDELEKLVSDLRGLLASKDLDGVPDIKQLRQRLDDGVQSVRDATVRAAQDAAQQARDAASAADRYAHDEPWRVAGAALAFGTLLGFLLSRR